MMSRTGGLPFPVSQPGDRHSDLPEFSGRHSQIPAEESGQMTGIVKSGLFRHIFEMQPLPEQGTGVTETVAHFEFREGYAVDLPENLAEPAYAQSAGLRRFPERDLPAVLEQLKGGNQFLIKPERCFRQIAGLDAIQQFSQHVQRGKPAMKIQDFRIVAGNGRKCSTAIHAEFPGRRRIYDSMPFLRIQQEQRQRLFAIFEQITEQYVRIDSNRKQT